MAINQVEYKVIDSSGTTHIEKYDISNFTQGYFYNGKFYDAESHVTELDAVNERIYIDIPTNRMYKYDGDYVLLSAGESVVFGYYYDDKFYTDSSFTEEITGSEGVLYVDKSTNYIYAFDSLFGFGVVGDTSMPVYRILSNVEYSNHSSGNYTVGNHLIYNKNLYKVIKAISTGDTLIRYEDDPTNGNIETEYPLQTQIEGKQNSTDNSLNTTSKTIVGAINEIDAECDKAYKTDDSSETALADDDYIPFYDTSATSKKKSTWINIIDKIKSAFGIVSGGTGFLKKDGTWATPTNTTYSAGTGTTITGANNAINVTYGTTANTACQGNDLRLSSISNPNLIDNPWFTVNQRQNNSYSASSSALIMVDRWHLAEITSGSETAAISDDGLKITASEDCNSSNLFQYLDNKKSLFGKKVTLSIIVDGNLYQTSVTVPTTQTSSWSSFINTTFSNGVKLEAFIAPLNDQCDLFMRISLPTDGTTRTIRAVKLEVGEISTLAMDVEPNYASELAKCQRYFYNANIENNAYSEIGTGFYDNGRIYINVPLPCQMRKKPSIYISGAMRGFVNGTNYPITDYTGKCDSSTPTMAKISITKSTNMPNYTPGMFSFGAVYGILQFSADI